MALLKPDDHWRVVSVLLGLVVASTFLGLLQFSGGHFNHPFVNDIAGSVSASFANRNHFALFAAIGCLLAPVWGFGEGNQIRWKGPVAIALLLLFALIILATGSRTGMLVGVLGIGLGLLNVRRKVVSELRKLRRPYAIALVAVVIALLAATVILSITLGRAASFNRVVALDVSDDLRRQALPTVWAMTQYYLPFGSGLGTFDPVFRINEPDELLNVVYFNHVHNDWIEIVLDAGLAGLVLLIIAIGWWLWKGTGAWRLDSSKCQLPRLGSAVLLLIFIASATDYPARTPMIMAVVVIAAIWLNRYQSQGAAAYNRPPESSVADASPKEG
nr:O-antigen ligase family protein [Croceibacterium selenioxidans]